MTGVQTCALPIYPERLWENAGQTLDSLSQRLEQAGDRLLENRQQKLEVITAKLGALDPYGVLRRGYTITENAQGKVVRQASDLRPGDTLVTRFAQGAAVSQVETVKEGKA